MRAEKSIKLAARNTKIHKWLGLEIWDAKRYTGPLRRRGGGRVRAGRADDVLWLLREEGRRVRRWRAPARKSAATIYINSLFAPAGHAKDDSHRLLASAPPSDDDAPIKCNVKEDACDGHSPTRARTRRTESLCPRASPVPATARASIPS